MGDPPSVPESATSATFESAVLGPSRSQPVLVDFWAAWCGPCRAIAPVLERLAAEFSGRARIVKVDADAEAELAARYGVRSLPTLAVFRGGVPVASVIGAQPEAVFRDLIEAHLDRPADRERRAALEVAASGNPEAAIATLRQLVAAEPARLPHRLALVDVLMAAGQLAAAGELLADAPVRFESEPALRERRARLELSQIGAQEMPEGALEQRHWAAARDFLAGRHSEALAAWLGVVRQQPGFGDGAAQRALRAAFLLLGDEHALVPASRRQMAALMN